MRISRNQKQSTTFIGVETVFVEAASCDREKENMNTVRMRLMPSLLLAEVTIFGVLYVVCGMDAIVSKVVCICESFQQSVLRLFVKTAKKKILTTCK